MEIMEYPYPLDLRWEHIQWYPVFFTRFMGSRFGLLSDLEVRGAAFTLWNVAMQSGPPATLTDDDHVLARLLQIPIEQWLELRGRSSGVLDGWIPVKCGDEIRLTHPVLLEALEVSVASHKLRQRGTRKREMWSPPDAGKAKT